MLMDFFSNTGIPRTAIFCSSLPGNDVSEKISEEIRDSLQSSVINIVILSRDYYQSAYCLNEAGILWYRNDVPVIPIALPEIHPDDMRGFLGAEYKLRHLDIDTDISCIYDKVSEALSSPQEKVERITSESNKLKNRYANFLNDRVISPVIPRASTPPLPLEEITTDDERIVLYYILQKGICRIAKHTIMQWLHENEILSINVDNAFDLLSSIGYGAINNDTLELDVSVFKKYSANASALSPELQKYVESHKKLSANTFMHLWNSDSLDSVTLLLFSYIVDRKMSCLGDRWIANAHQIPDIKQWEKQNSLDATLSTNYGSGLEFLIQEDLVYATEWTGYGNPRKYALYPSIQKLLFNCPTEIFTKLQKVKRQFYEEIPF